MRRTFALALCCALPVMAGAHPHEFVDTGLGFRFDADGRLGAVSVVWVYDDLTSLLILQDLGMDPDGDGILTDAETAEMVELSRTWPDDFDGNLHLTQNGAPIALSGPLEPGIEMRDGRLVMTHLRALTERRDPAAGPITAQAYDRTYYTFYDLAGAPQVMGRADCVAKVTAADIGLAQKLYEQALGGLTDEELMDQGRSPDVGGAFADRIGLTCAALP